GESLSSALAKHTGSFDEVFVSMVNTGEVSGTLDRIMDQTATYLERAETLRLKVQAALRYPIFILSFALLILVVMIVKIVPMFSGIYERFRVPLPLPTMILLTVSKVVVGNLLLVSGLLVIGGGMGYYFAQTERGQFWIDRTKFNLPLFVSRTLGILTSSGTQILYALKVMRPVPGNKVLERGIDMVRSRVEEGDALSRAMEDTGVFPEMLVQMTATGEETGQLDNMLSRTADFYEQRVTSQVDGLSSLVEPIAIIILGGLVGVMLLALYLPIFNLGQAMRSGLLGH
ncbi:MAG: type II secretion system F family protein, partial [Candidatus Eisenbacteria bacterium]